MLMKVMILMLRLMNIYSSGTDDDDDANDDDEGKLHCKDKGWATVRSRRGVIRTRGGKLRQ